MENVSVIRVTESFRIDESGQTAKVIQVLWKLGRHGPFTLEIRESQFTAELMKSELEKRASELRAALPPEEE